MITVLRSGRFRVVIYANDHEPAHVHVFCPGGEAKINLVGPQGADLIWAYGMTISDIRSAWRLVENEQALLLAKWVELHGRHGGE